MLLGYQTVIWVNVTYGLLIYLWVTMLLGYQTDIWVQNYVTLNTPTRKISTRKYIPTKKQLCSYVAKLFRFVTRFARVGILNSRPGGSREVLVSVNSPNRSFLLMQFQLFQFILSKNKVLKVLKIDRLGLLSPALLSPLRFKYP